MSIYASSPAAPIAVPSRDATCPAMIVDFSGSLSSEQYSCLNQ
jgi:hypothetical protein